MKYSYSENRIHYLARNLLNILPMAAKSRSFKKHYRICAIPNDLIGRSFAASGAYEAAGLAAVEWLCLNQVISNPRESTFVDIGANIGAYTLPLSFEFSSVLAYEPHPVTSKILSLNVVINNIENVKVINHGLSDADGTTLLYEPESENIGAASVEYRTDGITHPISLRQASEAIRQAQESRISFIKIDVEGHEKKVIDGLFDLLEEQHPVVAFEANDLSKNQRLIHALQRAGYGRFLALATRPSTRNPWIRAVILVLFGVKYQLQQVNDISSKKYSLVFALPEAN